LRTAEAGLWLKLDVKLNEQLNEQLNARWKANQNERLNVEWKWFNFNQRHLALLLKKNSFSRAQTKKTFGPARKTKLWLCC
jgi:hypothetical protein